MASSNAVGPRSKTTLRRSVSVELAPRSMMRASAPVCLPEWKLSESESEWPKVSTAERASACWETGVKIASRTSGVTLETKRSSTQKAAKPPNTAKTVAAVLRPWLSASMARPIQIGEFTAVHLPTSTRASAAKRRTRRPLARERMTRRARSAIELQKLKSPPVGTTPAGPFVRRNAKEPRAKASLLSRSVQDERRLLAARRRQPIDAPAARLPTPPKWDAGDRLARTDLDPRLGAAVRRLDDQHMIARFQRRRQGEGKAAVGVGASLAARAVVDRQPHRRAPPRQARDDRAAAGVEVDRRQRQLAGRRAQRLRARAGAQHRGGATRRRQDGEVAFAAHRTAGLGLGEAEQAHRRSSADGQAEGAATVGDRGEDRPVGRGELDVGVRLGAADDLDLAVGAAVGGGEARRRDIAGGAVGGLAGAGGRPPIAAAAACGGQRDGGGD